MTPDPKLQKATKALKAQCPATSNNGGEMLYCWLPKEHTGWHWDLADDVSWLVNVRSGKPEDGE